VKGATIALGGKQRLTGASRATVRIEALGEVRGGGGLEPEPRFLARTGAGTVFQERRQRLELIARAQKESATEKQGQKGGTYDEKMVSISGVSICRGESSNLGVSIRRTREKQQRSRGGEGILQREGRRVSEYLICLVHALRKNHR